MFLPTNLRPHLGHVHSAPRAPTAEASLIHVAVVDRLRIPGATSGPRNALLRSDVSQRTPLPEVEAPQSVRVYLPIKSRERPFRLSSSGAE